MSRGGGMNGHSRDEVIARHQRKRWREASQDASVRDRFGTPIHVGDLVVADAGSIPHYQVVDITPVLDPAAPPGLMQVVFTATIPMHTPANVPLSGVVLVRPMELTTEVEQAIEESVAEAEERVAKEEAERAQQAAAAQAPRPTLVKLTDGE